MTETWEKLYNAAKAAVCPHELSQHMCVGSVGAAVLTKDGNIYTGICIDTACSLGFCAERNALSTMFTHGEYEITHVCAVYLDGSVMPPCGACREFMAQLMQNKNLPVEILLDLDAEKIVTLRDLTPEWWL